MSVLTQSQHGMTQEVRAEVILWIYDFKLHQNFPITAGLLLPRLSQILGVIDIYLRPFFLK